MNFYYYYECITKISLKVSPHTIKDKNIFTISRTKCEYKMKDYVLLQNSQLHLVLFQ